MGRIVLQCRDEDARRRVEGAYFHSVPHVWCDHVEEVLERGRAEDVLGVVVGVTDQQGRPTAPAVLGLREARRDLPILLWCRLAETSLAGFVEACAAGVDVVLFRNAGPTEEWALTHFFPRESFPYQALLEQALVRRVPAGLRALVGFCLRPEHANLGVKEIGDRFGRSSRTLGHRLHVAHLPPVGSLLLWGRLLATTWDLTHSTASVERLALEHGFASAASFRTALKHRTTDVPRELRHQEDFGWVLRCFEHELLRWQRRGAAG